MHTERNYDCVIIGGGPAGATCATLLAQHGRSTLVLEKDRFPRHHIGESLMPYTYWTFQRLGMLEKLAASDFPRKQSVQFVSASGSESSPFFFPDFRNEEWLTTWQVSRDRFDQMMLDNAREQGADVRQGVRVSRVLFECEQAVGVEIKADGATEQIRAKVVVDASGQGAVLSRQLDLRYTDPHLQNGSIYAYYRGALRDEGRNGGATIVISTPNKQGWFWFIPLSDDVASIGVVAPPTFLFTGRGDDPMVTLEAEIAACPAIARRLAPATRISKAYVTSDFSYRSKRMAGGGWILIGDAFGFLDPVYSSGLMLALRSGECAADAIHDALIAGDLSAERLGRFGPQFIDGMQRLRQLVYAFYDRNFSFGKFRAAHPQYQDHLVRMLVGDVFNDEVGEMFTAMGQWVDLPGAIQLENGAASSGSR